MALCGAPVAASTTTDSTNSKAGSCVTVNTGFPFRTSNLSRPPAVAGAAGSGGATAGSSGGCAGNNACANTGGGSGGVAASTGGAGGSGVVILRAPGSTSISVAPGTNSIATLPSPAGGCKVASFTVSGTLTIS